MRLRQFILTVSCSILLPIEVLATPSCGGEPGWASQEFTGSLTHPEPGVFELGSRFFVLDPTEFGWRIGMLDHNGLGIAVFAASERPVDTSPLNISGWHFRNRANTGPNSGDVNAPQHSRPFSFGTLATHPALNPEVLTPGASVEGFGGRGVLTISDFELTPPKPGARAAFTNLTFSACLVWQGGGERLPPIVDADPGVAFDAVVAKMRGCGLETAVYRLSDRMAGGREGAQQPFLEPDTDGDNIPDLVVPTTRRSDGAPGLAICLIGTESLLMVG